MEFNYLTLQLREQLQDRGMFEVFSILEEMLEAFKESEKNRPRLESVRGTIWAQRCNLSDGYYPQYLKTFGDMHQDRPSVYLRLLDDVQRAAQELGIIEVPVKQ